MTDKTLPMLMEEFKALKTEVQRVTADNIRIQQTLQVVLDTMKTNGKISLSSIEFVT